MLKPDVGNMLPSTEFGVQIESSREGLAGDNEPTPVPACTRCL